MRVIFLTTLLCAGLARAQPAASSGASDAIDLSSTLNQYLSGYWKAHPASAATPAGVHGQDKELEDWSPGAVDREIARNRAVLERVEKTDPKTLTPDARADRERLLSWVRLTLADLEILKSPRTRPDRYVELLGSAVWSLASRQFAPAASRFASVVERLKQYPKFLKQARLDFDNPAEIHTRKALELLPATADYLEKGIPSAAVQQGVEKRALEHVKKEAQTAAAALRDFGKWMEASLLPRSKGNPLPEEKAYRQIFHDALGTEMTPEQVLEAAEQELSHAPVEPPAPPQSLDAFQVLTAFRQQERDARQFVEQKRIALIPMPDRLQFDPAPPFSPLKQTWLNPAGPFEPDLAFLLYVPNRPVAPLTREGVKAQLVRHGHPGGYLQRDAWNHTDSVVRKVFPNAAFIAGWEEYATVLAAEAGYQAPDPAHDRAVLLDAIFDVRLHLGKITPEEAVKTLVGQFRCTQAEAEYRVWQALDSPAALAAAFTGKLELMKLREDTRQDLGAAFILIEYHTKLLSLGAPSFASARELMKQK